MSDITFEDVESVVREFEGSAFEDESYSKAAAELVAKYLRMNDYSKDDLDDPDDSETESTIYVLYDFAKVLLSSRN